jgi:hypothetical protein
MLDPDRPALHREPQNYTPQHIAVSKPALMNQAFSKLRRVFLNRHKHDPERLALKKPLCPTTARRLGFWSFMGSTSVISYEGPRRDEAIYTHYQRSPRPGIARTSPLAGLERSLEFQVEELIFLVVGIDLPEFCRNAPGPYTVYVA